MQSITIVAADGYRLSATYATPVAESCGTIILSSATGIRKEFYFNFTQFLVQNGYNVLLYDYRGIGGSAPADLRTLETSMHEWGTRDMNAALNYIVHEKGKTNIIWLGHSVGAQLVALLENCHHIKKVIAVNAALGYWGYFPFPQNIMTWCLWFIVHPLMVTIYGYGKMKIIGWGENLPRNVLDEWKEWCISKRFFLDYLEASSQKKRFDNFNIPFTAVYTSDDYIANDKTVPLMMNFFPNSPRQIRKLQVKEYTREKVGHTGIFRKRFEQNLWPVLVGLIEG